MRWKWSPARVGIQASLVTAGTALLVSSCQSRMVNDATTSATREITMGSGCTVQTDDSVESAFRAARDPFAVKVLPASGCADAMKGKNPYAITAFMKGVGCQPARRFLVSEKSQLSFKGNSGVDPRTVDEWVCDGRTGAQVAGDAELVGKVFISGPGSAMHIISWDDENKTFNFYTADHPRAPAQIFYHGTSHAQAVSIDNSFRHPCTNCHVGGALLMKELRFPWAFWHSAVFESPAVTNASSSRGNPSESSGTGSQKVAIAEHMERLTMKSLTMANQSYVESILAGQPIGAPLPESPQTNAVRYKDALYPLFCERGVGLSSSPSRYGSSRLGVPMDLVLNRLIATKGGDFVLGSGIKAGQKSVTSDLDMTGDADDTDFSGIPGVRSSGASVLGEVTATQWSAAATEHFSLEGAKQADGDVFPMVVPSRLFADDDLVGRLVAEGIIPRDFALNVLLTDLQNPVFSATRCGLLDSIPATATIPRGAAAAAAGQKLVEDFEATLNASGDRSNPGSGAAKYLAAAKMDIPAKVSFVNGYVANCRSKIEAKPESAALIMAFRWKGFDKAPKAPFAGTHKSDFKGAVEDFVETVAVPKVKKAPRVGISQSCDVN